MSPLRILGLAALLLAAVALPVQAQVSGAGSTFAQLILAHWAQAYQQSQADAEFQPIGAALDYEPIGSQGGILRVRRERSILVRPTCRWHRASSNGWACCSSRSSSAASRWSPTCPASVPASCG